MPTQLNVTDPGEHVPEVERSIRTTKERTRSTTQSLPYKCYPRLLIKGIVRASTFNLNAFPARHGISRTLSPRNIVTGLPNLDYRRIRIHPGSYAQVHVDSTQTNTQKRRTIGAIALHQANENGSWYFMSLHMGEKIHSNNCVELPITDTVIDAVNARGREENQPIIKDGTPIFEWRKDIPFNDDDKESADEDSDREYNPEDAAFGDDHDNNPGDDSHDDEESHPSVDEDEIGNAPFDSDHDDDNNDDDSINDKDQRSVREVADEGASTSEDDNESNIGDEIDPHSEDIMHGDDIQDPPEVFPHDDSESNNQDERSAQSEHDNENETIEEPIMVGGHSLRGNRQRNYDHRFAFLQHAVNTIDKGERISNRVLKECYNQTVNICMTQMTAKRGIVMYGKRAVDAIFKEFAQLDDLNVFGPLDPSKLTRAQKRMALRAIVLVKEKRCRKIKGRTVADGRPQ